MQSGKKQKHVEQVDFAEINKIRTIVRNFECWYHGDKISRKRRMKSLK